MSYLLQCLGMLIIAPFVLAFSIFVLARLIDAITDFIIYTFNSFTADKEE